jgi:hypothetical protein
LRRSNVECWYCGATAEAGVAYAAKLYAPSSACYETRGYDLTSRHGHDVLCITVPRCGLCRTRFRANVGRMAAIVIGGMIGAPVLWSLFGTPGGPPPWWSGGDDPAHAIVGLGELAGFVGGLIPVACDGRRHRLPPFSKFPPIRTWRAAGWRWSLV